MTEKSFKAGFEDYFGHKCKFLVVRLFSVLSDRAPFKRLYFREFMDQFYWPLFTD